MTGIIGATLAAATMAFVAQGAHAEDGKRGSTGDTRAVQYRRVETKNYVLEVPEGWEVGQETPFGQREIMPVKPLEGVRGASMSSMTGPGLGRQSWEQLYQTSLYFITRYAPNRDKMQATPYKTGKSRQGFESCSWSMTDAEGRPIQRHVILKHSNGNILALSVKLPPSAAKEPKERLDALFQRMVDTAIVR